MRLSGTNNSVYSSKEETKECLEKKIRYINKQIEKLEKL
jgi:prefoldin subunit 5